MWHYPGLPGGHGGTGGECADCAEVSKCRYDEEVLRVEGGPLVGAPVTVASDFFPALMSLVHYAKACGVRLHVRDSLQWAEDPEADHHSTYGAAARFLVEDDAGVCDVACMRDPPASRQGVACFLGAVAKQPALRHNSTAPSDPTLFEGVIETCGVNATSVCDAATRKADLAALLGLFLDFGCAHNVYLPVDTAVRFQTTVAPPYAKARTKTGATVQWVRVQMIPSSVFVRLHAHAHPRRGPTHVQASNPNRRWPWPPLTSSKVGVAVAVTHGSLDAPRLGRRGGEDDGCECRLPLDGRPSTSSAKKQKKRRWVVPMISSPHSRVRDAPPPWWCVARADGYGRTKSN